MFQYFLSKFVRLNLDKILKMNFFIIFNGQQVGPIQKEQLKNFGLNPNTMVWTEGMPNWRPAYTVHELQDILREGSHTPPPFNGQYTYYPPKNDFFDSLTYTGTSGKSRLVFALFAIFLGWLGLQYFYVNKTSAGIISIILSLMSCLLWEILPFIQGVLVLVMSQEEFEKKYVYTTSSFPIF